MPSLYCNSPCVRIALLSIVLLITLQPTLSFHGSRNVSPLNRRTADHFPAYLSTRKGSVLSAPKLEIVQKVDPNEPEPISPTDTLLYGLLTTMQLLPPLALVDLPEPLDSLRRPVSYMYFIVSATILVVLGAKRQDLKQGPQGKPITLKSAALAPVVSSAVIFGIYLLLKYTEIEIYFDRVYQALGEDVTCCYLNHYCVINSFPLLK